MTSIICQIKRRKKKQIFYRGNCTISVFLFVHIHIRIRIEVDPWDCRGWQRKMISANFFPTFFLFVCLFLINFIGTTFRTHLKFDSSFFSVDFPKRATVIFLSFSSFYHIQFVVIYEGYTKNRLFYRWRTNNKKKKKLNSPYWILMKIYCYSHKTNKKILFGTLYKCLCLYLWIESLKAKVSVVLKEFLQPQLNWFIETLVPENFFSFWWNQIAN